MAVDYKQLGGIMKRLTLIIFLFICLSGVSFAGMRYLSGGELDSFYEILKNNNKKDMKILVAVYDDSYNPPRAGLKCVDKNGQKYQVFITGDKIVNINKTND